MKEESGVWDCFIFVWITHRERERERDRQTDRQTETETEKDEPKATRIKKAPSKGRRSSHQKGREEILDFSESVLYGTMIVPI